MGDLIGTKELVGAIVFLVGVIGTLTKIIYSDGRNAKKKLVTHEEKLEDQNGTILDLTGKINRMEGEQEGFYNGVERISGAVLDEIRLLRRGEK